MLPLRKAKWWMTGPVLGLTLAVVLAWLSFAIPRGKEGGSISAPSQTDTIGTMRMERLRMRHAALKRQLQQQAPTGPYIIVDTARNQLMVKQRASVLLSALASTGSGTILDNPDRPGSRWIFDTPRGEYTIQSRLMNPVWVKPDWAFLEEGLEVPKDPSERVEAGMLGEYALGFGKGYFIHGTLYKRLLGKNVTHGCIRLSDDDLKMVYRLTKLGTPVMIF
jgi:L,D-transpeptidase ErfK/SrfK